MIPSSRPKLSDLYALSQRKLLENHTLHSGPKQYLVSRSSKKRNRTLNTIPQVAKVYICTVKCQRKKHIENTFENQRPSTSPFFIKRTHLH